MKNFAIKLFIFALCLCFCLGSVSAYAVEPTYEVSQGYIAGGYYDRLLEYEATGDMRYDTVAIALTQLGYHEGDSDDDFDGLNLEGDRNYVEYNRMYGQVDNNEGNGVSYGYAWCAAFVTWSLRQARVPFNSAINSISCSGMTDWYVRNDAFEPAGNGYTPFTGDIIMFSNDGFSPSHVGLVLGVYDGEVYTVEGNNGANVGIHSYALDSDYIYGYCLPKYPIGDQDYEGLLMDNINKTGEFIVNAKSLNVRATPANDGELLGALEKNAVINVTALEGSWGKIEFEGKEGWVYMPHTTDADLMVYTLTYDLKGGKGIQNQRKLKGNSLVISNEIPTRGGYTFVGWSDSRSTNEAKYMPGDTYSADEDATLYAVWEECTYTVKFLDEDGTLLESFECKYNDWVPTPQEPTKASDGEHSYSFAGWSPELASVVVKNLEYTATYTAGPLIEESEAPADTENGDGGDYTVYIIIGAAAAAIIAAVAVIIAKKKKKAE